MPGEYVPEPMKSVYFEVMAREFLPRQNMPPTNYSVREGIDNNSFLANLMIEPQNIDRTLTAEFWKDPIDRHTENPIPTVHEGYRLDCQCLNLTATMIPVSCQSMV